MRRSDGQRWYCIGDIPTLVTPVLGTPASGNASNVTNFPASLVQAPCTTTATTGTSATLSTCFTVNQEATAGAVRAYTLPTASSGAQYCVDNGNGGAANTGALTVNASASGQYIVLHRWHTVSHGRICSLKRRGARRGLLLWDRLNPLDVPAALAKRDMEQALMRALIVLFCCALAVPAQILAPIMSGAGDIPLAPVDANSGGGCTGSSGAWTCTGTPTITLTDASASTIFYTLTGTAPNCLGTSGTLYTGPLVGPVQPFTLTAIGCNGITGGVVLTSVYTIASIPSVVSGQFCHGAEGTNPSRSLPSNSTTGNAILVVTRNSTGTPTLTGASFTQITLNTTCNTSGTQARIWYAYSITGG